MGHLTSLRLAVLPLALVVLKSILMPILTLWLLFLLSDRDRESRSPPPATRSLPSTPFCSLPLPSNAPLTSHPVSHSLLPPSLSLVGPRCLCSLALRHTAESGGGYVDFAYFYGALPVATAALAIVQSYSVPEEVLGSLASSLLVGKLVAFALLLLYAYGITFGTRPLIGSISHASNAMHLLSVLGCGYMLACACTDPRVRTPERRGVLVIAMLQGLYSLSFLLIHGLVLTSPEARETLPSAAFRTHFAIVSGLRWACHGWILAMTYDQVRRATSAAAEGSEDPAVPGLVGAGPGNKATEPTPATPAAAIASTSNGSTPVEQWRTLRRGPEQHLALPSNAASLPWAGTPSPLLPPRLHRDSRRRVAALSPLRVSADEAYVAPTAAAALGGTSLACKGLIAAIFAAVMTLPFVVRPIGFPTDRVAEMRRRFCPGNRPIDGVLWAPYAATTLQDESYTFAYLATAVVLAYFFSCILRANRVLVSSARTTSGRLPAHEQAHEEEAQGGPTERGGAEGGGAEGGGAEGGGAEDGGASGAEQSIFNPPVVITLHVRIQLLGVLLLVTCLCEAATLFALYIGSRSGFGLCWASDAGRLQGDGDGDGQVGTSRISESLLFLVFVFLEDGQGFLTFLLFGLGVQHLNQPRTAGFGRRPCGGEAAGGSDSDDGTSDSSPRASPTVDSPRMRRSRREGYDSEDEAIFRVRTHPSSAVAALPRRARRSAEAATDFGSARLRNLRYMGVPSSSDLRRLVPRSTARVELAEGRDVAARGWGMPRGAAAGGSGSEQRRRSTGESGADLL
jgi:hypothetical protein